jgi:hypothetical protein
VCLPLLKLSFDAKRGLLFSNTSDLDRPLEYGRLVLHLEYKYLNFDLWTISKFEVFLSSETTGPRGNLWCATELAILFDKLLTQSNSLQ